MRVLVITRAPWRNDNNTGNTMTNFFTQMKEFEFYNLYFRDQAPQNDVAVKSFAISEKQLVRKILKGTPVGKEILESDTSLSDEEEALYKKAKQKSSIVLTWLRDMLWLCGRWKSENFKNFLDDVKPDVIFMPVFNCFYPHRILKFVKKQTGAKVLLFHADDNYTLKQYSLSPIYWLYRFNLRKWVRSSVKISDENYAISLLQKEEYEKAFKKPFKVLTKGVDFSKEPNYKEKYNDPLQLVFTGNISLNRWRSLAKIADALEEINKDGLKAQLRIYTGNVLTEKMSAALNRGDSSVVMGSVPASEVAAIQNAADILVHVEAFDTKNKLAVRQSFSTKIVDYFAAARPVLAFGPKDVASIDHLIKNDCAIVADSHEELVKKLNAAIQNPQLLTDCAVKGYKCGQENHSIERVTTMLSQDFNN